LLAVKPPREKRREEVFAYIANKDDGSLDALSPGSFRTLSD
jgi:hypothetical protein